MLEAASSLLQLRQSLFEYLSAELPFDMAINWMTETAYFSYGYFGIVAYDLNTFKYARVYEGFRQVYELSVLPNSTGG